MAGFVETQLDLGEGYEILGGPEYQTEIIELESGEERRNQVWERARAQWEAGNKRVLDDLHEFLRTFFRARAGRSVGFRFKDWTDYIAANEPLPDPDGSPTIQLRKSYTDSGQTDVRIIRKPVSGTVSIVDGSGNTVAIASVDTTTGIVTFTPLASANIDDIAQDAVGTVTTASSHGYSNGDYIWITNVDGMTEVNDQVYQINVTGSTTFELGVDTSGFSAYQASANDVAEKYPQPGTTLLWSGEFDIPARFDTDRFESEIVANDGHGRRIHSLGALPIIELKNE